MLIGTDGAGAGVRVDLPRLLESRLLIQANSGAGKSWAIRRLLEQTYGEVQHIVIDLEDEFHTLRERFGYVLAGRDGGDCPAEPKSANLLARRLLELGVSAIIGIAELKAHDRAQFVKLFLEGLIAAPRALWHPVLVVVDEAHQWCPQTGKSESASAVIDLMTRGRKRGFCGVLATQRISKLHKDAAAEANNKLIGRSALDVDMKRAADELGFSSREQQHALRTLAAGEFFAFGPAIAEEVALVKVGPVETTHPQPGARGLAPTAAPEGLQAAIARLADLPREAEQQQQDAAALRARIAELERALAGKGPPATPVIDQAAIAQARDQGIREGQHRAWTEGSEDMRALQADVENLFSSMRDRWIDQSIYRIPIAPPNQPQTGNGHNTPSPAPVAQKRPAVASGPPVGARQRILDALAWLESVGIMQASKVQLAILAGTSPSSSGYANNLGALRTSGHIEYPGPGEARLTSLGRINATSPDRPPSSADLHATLAARLPRPQWRILQVLIGAHPEPIRREELAGAAEQSATSSGFANNLGALRSLGFIDYPAPGHVKAKPVLFVD